ncbi:MAG: hypothetical protein IJR13_04585 [Bacteroidales bacterium]|nr:hypothetical protein [Bacteroidales bacterium]
MSKQLLRSLFVLFIAIIFCTPTHAQRTPQKFSYQATVRNSAGQILSNATVRVRISIFKDSESGTTMFRESHTPTTNINGVFNVVVGEGSHESGNIADIDWGNGIYFLVNDVDVDNDGVFDLTASQQLLAVPYALHCDEYQSLFDVVARNNRAGMHQLKDVKNPTDPQDAVTKFYLDSIMNSISSLLSNPRRDTVATACISLNWRGDTYSQSGLYMHILRGAGCDGTCDSVLVLHLSINAGSHNVIRDTSCSGSYTWVSQKGSNGGGQTFTSSGTYYNDYTDGNGCASADTLRLKVGVETSGNKYVEECEQYTWNEMGNTIGTYYASNIDNADKPTARRRKDNSQGCDSIVTLYLTILQPQYGNLDTAVCDIFVWQADEDGDGNTYTASTTEPYPVSPRLSGSASNGCDSLTYLHLTINHNNGIYDNQTICEGSSLSWYGGTYTDAVNDNSVRHPFNDINGCPGDSILVLSVNSRPSVTLGDEISSTAGTTLCAGNSTTLSIVPTAYDGAISYQWSPADGLSSASASSVTATPADTITYTVTVTASREACEDVVASKNITINVIELPTSGIIGSLADGTVCRGSSVVLDGAASFTPAADEVSYSWSAEPAGATAGMPANVGTASIEVSPTVQTTYTVTATPSRGGCAGTPATHSATLTILEPTHLAFTHTAIETFTWAETDNDGSQNGTHGTGETYTDDGTHTYVSSYTNADGCPSSDTLYLTIVNTKYGDTTAVACGRFRWHGITYTESTDTATHTYTSYQGVDSIVTLHLTIKPWGTSNEAAEACDSYTWKGETYDESGTYTYTVTGGSANGCDSIVSLALTIKASKTGTATASVCDSYTWEGTTYTESGTPTHAYTAANECDSVVTLNLTIRRSTTYADVQAACDSYEWIDGNTYTASNSTATHALMNSAGCDSTITLNLTLGYSTVSTDVQSACDSYEWLDGNTYTEDNNTATYFGTNGQGCPDTKTLNLTINHATVHTDIRVECDSYTWIDGQTYTASTTTPTYTVTGGNSKGCDSVVTLYLTINASTSTNLGSEYVCSTTTTWHGNTYAVPGTYSYVSSNAAGCPLTETKTFNYGVTFANNAQRVTVCAGTTGYPYYDTLLFEQFTSAPSYASNNTSTTQWIRRSYASYNNWAQTARARNGSTYYYDYNSGNTNGGFLCVMSPGNSSYQGACSYIWTPTFTYTNPANTTIRFRFKKVPYSTSRDNLFIYITNASDPNSVAIESANVNQNGTQIVSSNTTHVVSNSTTGWTAYEYAFNSLRKYTNGSWSNIGSLSAGTYRIKFMYQDNLGLFAGIDDILIREQKNLDLTSVPNGGYYSNTTVTTNGYGCPHYSGLVIHKQTAGETYNEVACESYRWINNTTYTTNQTNTGYTHTISENGTSCSITDRLNLTIGSSAGDEYTHTASNAYTWPTSGAMGHGTGMVYTESGDYTGPNYGNGSCNSRDVLHLTIDNNCSGLRNTITVCDNYTWLTSGAAGHGTGSNYTAEGRYVGPAYNTDVCTGLHDTIDLVITGNVTEDFYITACDSYTWPANSQTYTSVPGSAPSVTLTSAAGCDSTVTLRLTLASSTSNTSTPTYCGGNYTWSTNGETYTEAGTYTYNTVNAAGCPQTETLVLTDGNEYNVVRDTVCLTNPVVVTYDTIAAYDFEDDMDDSDWGVWNMCNTGGWNFYEQCYGYPPRTGSGQLAAPDEGNQCYGGDFSNGAYRNRVMTAINLCWSAAFTITDPANTTIEFWAQKPAWSGTVGVLGVYIVPTSNWLIPDLSGTEILYSGGTVAITNWARYQYPCSSLSAGTYRLKFVHQDNDGDHDGIDDIIIFHRNVTDYSSYGAGATVEDVTRTPIANGCSRITGTTHFVQSTGQSKVVEVCDSYTWVDNGMTVGTYTTSGTYTHTYTANGCPVTNTLILTINHGVGNEYGCNCADYPENCPANRYTWTTSGLNGHGTGQTYTTSGTYVGPYYTDSHGCYARDTLKLTIN